MTDTDLADMKAEMRAFRAAPPPPLLPIAPMTEQQQKLFGCDTAEGRLRWQRTGAWRHAGYTGPLDQDANIPDPDDPAQRDDLVIMAQLRAVDRAAMEADL